MRIAISPRFATRMLLIFFTFAPIFLITFERATVLRVSLVLDTASGRLPILFVALDARALARNY
jgi:hypothetical protein